MALPHWLAQLNLRFANRFTRPVAARLPWFCVLEHVGRRSGIVRRTAMLALHRDPDRWVIALTYGTDAQWLANVQAAGGCRLLTRGRWIDLGEPRRFRDPSRASVPRVIRLGLAVLRVDRFLELRERG